MLFRGDKLVATCKIRHEQLMQHCYHNFRIVTALILECPCIHIWSVVEDSKPSLGKMRYNLSALLPADGPANNQ